MIRKVSIKDIAKHVGVAPSTVSRVLNKASFAYPVSQKTRNKIFAAVKELNYTPNINARRLARKVTNTIALVLPSCVTEGRNVFSDFTLVKMLEGIEEEILKKEYRLLLMFKNKKFTLECEYLRLFNEGSIDGMLIWGYDCADHYIQKLHNYPVVLTNSRPQNDPNINYVGHDNVSGIRAITQKLIDRGYRCLHYFSGILATSIFYERLEGFKQAIEDNGLTYNKDQIFEVGFLVEDGYNALMRLHDSGHLKKDDAIICSNDDSAIGCYKAATELGLKIPDDIIITGADGVQPHLELSPHLPTFEVNCIEMGRLAVTRLLELIKTKDKKPSHDILPVKLKFGDNV